MRGVDLDAVVAASRDTTAALAQRAIRSRISGSVSGSGTPNWPPGSASCTADGALGCGLTLTWVWRPAWLICTQALLPFSSSPPPIAARRPGLGAQWPVDDDIAGAFEMLAVDLDVAGDGQADVPAAQRR